ncbi:MAG: T9SS type A sorting domain-containing protein [Bacteroidetes bacterium]|nr:T9SS type A sorting domain-containing protein [Bacteroidota bacterium]
MKKIFIVLTILFAATQLWAQVNQTVIIEHFTNSRCSVCAARNPAFYSLINDYPEVLHIAYHPSSPYSTCIFSQHNPAENDARTNYYGIYGGTPRVVVQGKVVAPQNPLLMASQIEEKLGQAAHFSVLVEQIQNNDQEAEVNVMIKKISESEAALNLYAVIAEKEINYNAPNGETMQHDVFRKVLFDIPVTLTNVGDSVVMNGSYSIDNEWVANQMFVAVMLQDESSKAVLQSAASELLSNPQSISDQQITVRNDLFIPNPAIHFIRLNNEFEKQIVHVEIYDLRGQILLAESDVEKIDISSLNTGLYVIIARDAEGFSYSSKLLKTSY